MYPGDVSLCKAVHHVDYRRLVICLNGLLPTGTGHPVGMICFLRKAICIADESLYILMLMAIFA